MTATISTGLSVENASAAARAPRYTTSTANRNPRRPGTRAYRLLVGILVVLGLGLGRCLRCLVRLELGFRLCFGLEGVRRLDQRRSLAASLHHRRVRGGDD